MPVRLGISNLTDAFTLFVLGRLEINRMIFWEFHSIFANSFSCFAVAIKLATPFNLLLVLEIFQIATPSSVFLSTPFFRTSSITMAIS